VQNCSVVNPLTPNDPYRGRSTPLTSKVSFYIFIPTNIVTEYFKHGIHSPFFPLQNAVSFIILTYLVPVLFTFYIQGVLKLKNNSGAKRLMCVCVCLCVHIYIYIYIYVQCFHLTSKQQFLNMPFFILLDEYMFLLRSAVIRLSVHRNLYTELFEMTVGVLTAATSFSRCNPM